MIFEFAIDPQEIASWASEDKYNRIIDAFGVGQPRIMARLPKRWKWMVWNAATVKHGSKDEERLTEVIEMLSEVICIRDYSNHNWETDWLSAALHEHNLDSFHSIISTGKPDPTNPTHLVYDQLESRNDNFFGLDPRANFDRNAKGFGECFGPLLKISRRIKFVDAHLNPRPEFSNVAKQLFSAAAERHGSKNVEVEYFCKNTERETSWDLFKDKFKRWPNEIIPKGMQVQIVRLNELDKGSERFHDRLVMTEYGGAYLPDSLSEGRSPAPGRGRSTLLKREDYTRSWNVFRQDTTDFGLDGVHTLEGV